MVVATALPGGARLSCARGGKAHATASPLRQPRPPTSSPAAAGCRPPRLTRPARPPPPSASSISASQADPSPPPSPSHPLIRLVALCPAGVASPVARGEATWAAVLAHEGLRLAWSDAAIALTVFEDEGTDGGAWDAAVARADGVVVASVPDDGATGAAARALLARPSLAAVPTVAPLGCGPALTTALWRSGGVRAYPTSMLGRAAAALPWSRTAAARAAAGIAAGLWARSHSDDALAALAVVLDAGGTPQPSVEALKGRGPCTLLCMLTHCREQVLACVTDPTCKAGLDALTAAPPGDAVAAYRAITSFECDAFSAFSLCVLQKHRCLGVDAEIPARPYHPPAASWRGQPLTHELAETIFVGWLAGGDPISWHVAAGQNPGALTREMERAGTRACACFLISIPKPLTPTHIPCRSVFLSSLRPVPLPAPALLLWRRKGSLLVRPGFPGGDHGRPDPVAAAPLPRAAGGRAGDLSFQCAGFGRCLRRVLDHRRRGGRPFLGPVCVPGRGGRQRAELYRQRAVHAGRAMAGRVGRAGRDQSCSVRCGRGGVGNV